MPDHLSRSQARRIALAAQGFADPRPAGRVDARHLRRVIARMGLLQLDSVNVFCRSHYLPVFARLGPYPRELLDTLTAHTAGPVRRELIEYWAHEASLVPVEHQPLLRWRMARAESDPWPGVRRLAREKPQLLEDIMADLECEVVRSALTLKEALDASQTVDAQAAILDINLAGDPIFPVAERLAARGIPLIFASGYGSTTLPDAWKGVTTLPKPFSAIQVEAALRTVLGFATA